jgi:uncharacterized RDD family membrane protein YckC
VTAADERDAPGTAYPWHDVTPSVAAVAGTRSGIRGTRAGIVTRSIANSVDVAVVLLLLAVGYAAVAATRFLLRPATFTLPTPRATTLLLVGLVVLAVYFAVTWAVVGGTYGDRLLGLRVGDDGGARLGWARSALRAVLCTIFPIGLVWVLVSRENRCLQDVLLRTSVVYD